MVQQLPDDAGKRISHGKVEQDDLPFTFAAHAFYLALDSAISSRKWPARSTTIRSWRSSAPTIGSAFADQDFAQAADEARNCGEPSNRRSHRATRSHRLHQHPPDCSKRGAVLNHGCSPGREPPISR
jgi:hypothetical protein